MHPQLEAIVGQMDAATTRLHALERRIPADLWPRRRSGQHWSPAECVAHLNLTSEAMLPRFRAALDEARRLGPTKGGTYRRDLIGWLIWKSLTPGNRVKTSTVKAFMPTRNRPGAELVAEFDRLHRELIDLTRQADGWPIDRVKLTSPFNARVRYNLYTGLTINTTHDHRHLLQAERALVTA